MKKIVSMMIAGVAMVALSGCELSDLTGGSTQVYIENLNTGYKISGRDTTISKDVDLCFVGGDYVYGRGSEYFIGTFYVDSGDIVFRDATDGGAYRLETSGEITDGLTYSFSGITNNIRVSSITRSSSVNDCKGFGNNLRAASSLGLANPAKK